MKIKTIRINKNPIHFIDEPKFNTINLVFVMKNRIHKKTHYLMPLVANLLSNACQKYSSMAAFHQKKEELYDVRVNAHVQQIGKYQNLMISFSGIDPSFSDNSNYLNEFFDFINEVIFAPFVNEGGFDESYFDLQKSMLIEQIKASEDDKEQYAHTHISHWMPVSHPLHFNLARSLRKLQSADRNQCYQFYLKLLSGGLDIYLCGHNIYRKTHAYLKKLPLSIAKKRAKATIIVPFQSSQSVEKAESKKWSQSQLILRYRFPIYTLDPHYFSAYVYNTLLGSSATSRLFKKIREEHALCYSIYSQYLDTYGLLDIHVGFSLENYDKLIRLIEQEIHFVAQGHFSDNDLDQVKKILIDRQLRKFDTGFGMIGHVHTANLLGVDWSISDIIKRIENVTKEDVKYVACQQQLLISYLIKQNNGGKRNES